MPAATKKASPRRKQSSASSKESKAVLQTSKRITSKGRALIGLQKHAPVLKKKVAIPDPAPPELIWRSDQASFTPKQWRDFIAALRTLHRSDLPAPNYVDFARAYQHGHHQHQAHGLPYFLPWHREYLWHFEARLRRINPRVSIPYWNWVSNPEIPARLGNAGEWSTIRNPNVRVPDTVKEAVNALMGKPTYNEFSNTIEALHLEVRPLIGGAMALHESEPQDVLFWLHHAFIDKLWADWQAAHPGSDPTSAAYDIWLKPQVMSARAMFTHKAREMWNVGRLGYGYR